MWTEIKEAPGRVRELGLSGEPVYSASEGAWYALSGDRIMRHPGLGAGLGDPATLLAAAQAATDAIDNDSNYCANVSINGTTVNSAVHAFKVAWNADNPSAPLAYNGLYDSDCVNALSSALGGATIAAACPAAAPAPPTPTPPTVIPPAGDITPTPSSYTAPILIGAGVVAAGLIGWAVWAKPKKKHVTHAAHAAEEASRYHARRARKLRAAASRY